MYYILLFLRIEGILSHQHSLNVSRLHGKLTVGDKWSYTLTNLSPYLGGSTIRVNSLCKQRNTRKNHVNIDENHLLNEILSILDCGMTDRGA